MWVLAVGLITGPEVHSRNTIAYAVENTAAFDQGWHMALDGEQDGKGSGRAATALPAAQAARVVMRSGLKASLATLESGSGFPYVSLVTVGFRPDGTPLLLLSRLAVHTRNLKGDQRASLLFDASDGAGDPLAGGRVTVMGRMEPVASDAVVRRRFLARHPGAEMYVDFADFGFWELIVERAHFIGGFGRIIDLTAAEMLDDVADAQALIAAEADIIAHMNDDHGDAVELYATQLGGASAGAWRLTSLDPAGFDLVNGAETLRLSFANRVTNPDSARAEFVRMAKAARSAEN